MLDGLSPANLPLCAHLLDSQFQQVADVTNVFRCVAVDARLALVYIVGGATSERGASPFQTIVDIRMSIDGEKYPSSESAVKVLGEV